MSSIDGIQLTTSQQLVFDKIVAFSKQSQDRVFILKGYAGTGKTTLMRFLIWRKRSIPTQSERFNPPTFESEIGLKTA